VPEGIARDELFPDFFFAPPEFDVSITECGDVLGLASLELSDRLLP
jgi:hypothetical protein